jgi:hypothetical protein
VLWTSISDLEEAFEEGEEEELTTLPTRTSSMFRKISGPCALRY